MLKRSLFLIFSILFPAIPGFATTYTSTTCTSADVQSKMNSATSAGDEVFLDCATGSWTSQVYWPAPANSVLRGRGSTSIDGGNDLTIITDNDTTNHTLLFITTVTGTFRMYGITLKGGTGLLKEGAVIGVNGVSSQIRIDHCHIDFTTYSTSFSQQSFYFAGNVFGVFDHNIMDPVGIGWINIANGDTGDTAGHTEWNTATAFGGARAIYIEDNLFTYHAKTGSTAYDAVVDDCFTAGRVVIRFNTNVDTSISQTHPTGHSSSNRGCRQHETYANLITSNNILTPNEGMVVSNSGPGLDWNNQSLNVEKNIFVFYDVRNNNATYTQQTPPNGWGYCGSAFNGLLSNWDRNDNSTGYACIDQVGRGIGDLLSGAFPTLINSSTGTVAWPHQALEPRYMWMNNATIAMGGGGSYYSLGTPIVADRDVYEQASGIQTNATTPFNGTTGTGWGTLANRPTTCTTGAESGGGVGYFATDQGSWNTSSSNSHGVQMSGADGLLYKCTATNTWTLYYTPYTYPHPLVSGVSCTPAKVLFSSQPSSAVLSATLGTVSAGIYDSSNTLCTDSTATITLSKNGSATWGTLVSSSNLAKAATAGVATWTDLSVTTTAGSGSINADSSGLTGAVSNSITITSGATGVGPGRLRLR